MASDSGRTEERATGDGDTRQVAGRYRLHAVLGRGAMGTVWAGRDELLHRDVAIKEVVPPHGLDEDQRTALRERTLREARAAARINSSAAVTVYDVVEEDERPWIVMERLGTRTLDDMVRDGGPLPVAEVAAIGLSVLDGLEAAHAAGVMHRDVKPGNVMVGEVGSNPVDGGSRVVLTDFGIAHLDGDASTTSTGLVMGSPQYLAPERAQGQAATPASDLWSLGATLFAAVEGRPPFEREGPLPTLAAIVNEDAPPATRGGDMAPVLAALLSRDPAERPDAATTRELLSRVAGGRDLPDAAVSAAATPAPSRRRRSWFVLGLVAAAGVLAALLVALVLLPDPDPQAPPAQSSSDSPSAEEPVPEPSTPAPSGSPAQTATEPPLDTAPIVPQGFRLHEDETGFSVAVPEGWTVERDGTRVQLDDPGSSRFLRVDQTDTPQADPVEDWERQEESVSQRLENYERISIEPVEYRDYDAADWQFTFGADDRTRVLNRNMITSPDQAYALYWSTPEGEYDDAFGTFEVIAETFTPAPLT